MRGRSALVVCSAVAMCSALFATTATPATAASSTSRSSTPYPNGVFDVNEPSYLAPPGPSALAGYSRTYVDDFREPLQRSMWFYFSGVPKGDPSGRFDPGHVAVQRGMLKIGTWRDPRFGNAWVSGGAGLSGIKTLYGAYFVRSRETSPGPDTVELLWPTNNQWPPEIDFDEAGTAQYAQWWFVHYHNASDQAYGHTTINVDHWHTYGVIWTPSSITFTVDGNAWGEVTASGEIPSIPMELDLQQQSWCGISGEPCPTHASTLEVDWVAVYTPNG